MTYQIVTVAERAGVITTMGGMRIVPDTTIGELLPQDSSMLVLPGAETWLIADGLGALSSRLGERALFVGSPRAQATPELLHWPQLAAYLRQPFDIPAPRPVVIDPQARWVVELAGLAYELTLHVLLRFFTHTDETDSQLGTLFDAALALMAKVLRPLCTELTTLPVGPSHPGRTAGFAFEMYYVMGNMTPHREPSWALLAERARILAHRCRQLATDRDDGADPFPAVSGAAEQAQTVADLLTAHVPEALRPPPGREIPT